MQDSHEVLERKAPFSFPLKHNLIEEKFDFNFFILNLCFNQPAKNLAVVQNLTVDIFRCWVGGKDNLELFFHFPIALRIRS